MEAEVVKKAAADAAELVKNIPAEFRGHAFHVLFDLILEPSARMPITKSSVSQKSRASQVDQQNRAELIEHILHSNVDFSSYHPILEDGSWAERVMVTLYVLEKELGVESLTPPEIANIMTSKLRLPNVYAQNIGRAITTNMEYFVRSQEGQAYKYSLSSKGISYLEKLLSKEEKDGKG